MNPFDEFAVGRHQRIRVGSNFTWKQFLLRPNKPRKAKNQSSHSIHGDGRGRKAFYRVSMLSVSCWRWWWWLLCLLALNFSLCNPYNVDENFADDGSILCRIILLDTMFATDDGSFRFEHETACVPMLQNKERDKLLRLTLPETFYAAHETAIEQSRLFVLISRAETRPHHLVLTNRSQVVVVDPPSDDTRQLQKLRKRTIFKTVTMVRVSVVDSEVTQTADEIDEILFGGGLNFVSQYHACSFGSLLWMRSPHGVLNVRLNQTLAELGDGTNIATMALEQIRDELHLEAVTDLADHIMVCVPPGTGDWAANAGVSFWRSQFNNDWCTSLSANMHELGHNLGLLHSNEVVLYGDNTGYSGYKNIDWPRRCFNGQNHWYLGWYRTRRLSVDPFQEGPKLIHLAAFVDYEKTSKNEPVVVKVGEMLFLQYNRAKGINIDTGEKPDKVTVTEAQRNGTQCLAGLETRDVFTYQLSNGTRDGQLVIEVCEALWSNGTGPDVMVVSVGLDTSLCTLQEEQQHGNSNNLLSTDPPSTQPTVSPGDGIIAPPSSSPLIRSSVSVHPSMLPSTSIESHPIPYPTATSVWLPSNLKCDEFGIICENVHEKVDKPSAAPLPLQNPPTLRPSNTIGTSPTHKPNLQMWVPWSTQSSPLPVVSPVTNVDDDDSMGTNSPHSPTRYPAPSAVTPVQRPSLWFESTPANSAHATDTVPNNEIHTSGNHEMPSSTTLTSLRTTQHSTGFNISSIFTGTSSPRVSPNQSQTSITEQPSPLSSSACLRIPPTFAWSLVLLLFL